MSMFLCLTGFFLPFAPPSGGSPFLPYCHVSMKMQESTLIVGVDVDSSIFPPWQNSRKAAYFSLVLLRALGEEVLPEHLLGWTVAQPALQAPFPKELLPRANQSASGLVKCWFHPGGKATRVNLFWRLHTGMKEVIFFLSGGNQGCQV